MTLDAAVSGCTDPAAFGRPLNPWDSLSPNLSGPFSCGPQAGPTPPVLEPGALAISGQRRKTKQGADKERSGHGMNCFERSQKEAGEGGGGARLQRSDREAPPFAAHFGRA